MRTASTLAALAAVFVALPARAHIKMVTPADALVVDADGDPQKAGQCPTGTASNIVTTVRAGQTLTVAWTETIPHPGHFRISYARDRAAFTNPAFTGMCNATISPAGGAILFDGLFPHDNSVDNQMYSQAITIPNEPCEKCTLQVMQVMTDRASGCFYYHCMDLKVVSEMDGGPVEEIVPPSTTDGGTETDPEADPDDTTSPGSRRLRSTSESSGCGVSTHGGDYAVLGLLSAVGLSLVRRRRRAA